MQRFLILLFVLKVFDSYSQDSVRVNNHAIANGTITVHTTIYYPYSSSITFVNLHDDENTSVEAALIFIADNGGEVVQLQHSGRRRFAFVVNTDSISFDPNRIFTEKGITATLRKGKDTTSMGLPQVKQFADSFLRNYISKKTLVIALHNNTRLSILSYKKGGSEFKNAGKVYMNRAMHLHDFILTTELSIYNQLKGKRINVVWQKPNPIDDGSLSVYAAKNKIPYINVEALDGHLEEQLKMLQALKDIIARY